MEPTQQQPVTPTEPALNAAPALPPKGPKKGGMKAVVIILVILAAAGAGYGGFYFGKTMQKTDSDAAAAALRAKVRLLEVQNEALKAQAKSDSADTASYLTIKEWGVKFQLNNAITGIRYVINDDEANLTSDALVKSSKYCDPTLKIDGGDTNNFGAGAIGRTKSKTSVQTGGQAAPVEQAFPGGITVAGYYYYYIHAQGLCSGETQAQTDQEAAFVKGLDSAVKTLKAE